MTYSENVPIFLNFITLNHFVMDFFLEYLSCAEIKNETAL